MKYAIDIPMHQQLYVKYENHKEIIMLKETLENKGFVFAEYIGTCDYSFPIVVINCIDKIIFGTNAINMACAMQCNAIVLSTKRFINELEIIIND